ncbi:hypothetical protein [Streptomyces sp. Qhu_M48]|uniref:hypothetical protein n=1 Tax=Streptomyces sp. Qhu_M48 TaxID=3435889 RepID=UPI003F4FC08C
MTDRETLEGARGLADSPGTARPDDFAPRVVHIVHTEGPRPCASRSASTRTDAWTSSGQAAREEYAAMRALAGGPPPAV